MFVQCTYILYAQSNSVYKCMYECNRVYYVHTYAIVCNYVCMYIPTDPSLGRTLILMKLQLLVCSYKYVHFSGYCFHESMYVHMYMCSIYIYIFACMLCTNAMIKYVNRFVCNDLGAVYQAAALSKAFVVKKFLIREATVYPIEVRNSTCFHECIHMF